jgi:hypothetical protein
MSKITKATAKKMVRQYAADLNVEIDSDTITIWYADHWDPEKEHKAAEALHAALGGALFTDMFKSTLYYKKAPRDKGDWNDRCSRWHY